VGVLIVSPIDPSVLELAVRFLTCAASLGCTTSCLFDRSEALVGMLVVQKEGKTKAVLWTSAESNPPRFVKTAFRAMDSLATYIKGRVSAKGDADSSFYVDW
jgi:hypothetical protein